MIVFMLELSGIALAINLHVREDDFNEVAVLFSGYFQWLNIVDVTHYVGEVINFLPVNFVYLVPRLKSQVFKDTVVF